MRFGRRFLVAAPAEPAPHEAAAAEQRNNRWQHPTEWLLRAKLTEDDIDAWCVGWEWRGCVQVAADRRERWRCWRAALGSGYSARRGRQARAGRGRWWSWWRRQRCPWRFPAADSACLLAVSSPARSEAGLIAIFRENSTLPAARAGNRKAGTVETHTLRGIGA